MSETKHPIQIVSRRTGLSADVIRAWERRYKAVKPSRSANGRRLYSDNDLKKLMLLQRIISGGRRIGDIAKLNIKSLSDINEGYIINSYSLLGKEFAISNRLCTYPRETF